MNAVWIDVPASFLEERRRLGHDKRDELWEGVLHMVPPATLPHQLRSGALYRFLYSIATRRDWLVVIEAVVFAPDVDPISYRVPDLAMARRDQAAERGFDGAQLVVEILSPRDESYAKLPFYARIGVCEVWIIEPTTRRFELYVPIDGAMVLRASSRSPLLDVAIETIETTDGPRLRLTDGHDVAEI